MTTPTSPDQPSPASSASPASSGAAGDPAAAAAAMLTPSLARRPDTGAAEVAEAAEAASPTTPGAGDGAGDPAAAAAAMLTPSHGQTPPVACGAAGAGSVGGALGTRLEAAPIAADDYDLTVVATPWYPTPHNPMWGTFVRDAVIAMSMHHWQRIAVVHVDGNPLYEGEAPPAADEPAPGTGGTSGAEGVDSSDGAAASAESDAEPGRHRSARVPSWSWWESRPEADVLIIRAPHPSHTPRSTAMEIHREALREHAGDVIERAKVLSAHVGGPTGAAIAPLLARRTRFTITEHATYVRALFKDTSAAIQYRAAVGRASRLLAVSDGPAAGLRRLCPQQADHISAVPNPVRFDILPLRDEPVRHLDRWLYVGNLVTRKGVHRLVEAFAQEVAAGTRPGAHLTLVGDGPEREALVAQVAAAGITDRVTFAGQVDPGAVSGYFTSHDVLVHLSDYETFGLTVVEAVATGLPVVVTRCGGPEETMVIPEGFGMTQFVDVDPDPQAVRDAVAALRTDHTAADIEEVRAMMRSLYGFERAADLLAKYVYGATQPPLAPPLDLSIVVAFQGPAQWRRVQHGADRAADVGADIVAVDLEDGIASVPAGVSLVTPGHADRYNAVRATERLVVDRAPRAVLAGAERLVPRLPQRYAARAMAGLTSAERLQHRVANASEQRVYRLLWGVVRGRSMARRVEVQPELADIERLDVLVHLGGRLTQLAYRLAVRHPEAIVHHGPFTAAHIARWWLAVHGPKARAERAAEL